jgi:hypothetical protein
MQMEVDTILVSLSGLRTPDGQVENLHDERIETSDSSLRDDLLDKSIDKMVALAAKWRREGPGGRLVCYLTLIPLSGQASIALGSTRLTDLAREEIELHLDALGG